MTVNRSRAAGRFPEGRLLVFAKAPAPGEVKTRLIPALGALPCARLYRALVEHTLALATAAALCPVELWCTPSPHDAFLQACARRFRIQLRTQRGSNLGTRMYHALTSTTRQSDFAIIIGCDCPALGGPYLAQACAALAAGVPIVIGPAEDGGYVLIGARRPVAPVFSGIDWGTRRVLEQTRAWLRDCGLRWNELAPLWDIDRPDDLARLAAAGVEVAGAPIPLSTPASRPGSVGNKARA